MWTFVIFFLIVLLVGWLWYNRYRVKQAQFKYPPAGQFVSAEGIRLHYISKGNGKPIVFLHGGVLTGRDFERVLDLAAEEGYRAIAFDRPGYGYSERPRNEAATPFVQARLLHAALAELGIRKPILVGHSWSGALVLSYALLYPGEMDGIITLGAAMYKEGYPAEHGDPLSKLATTPIVGDLLLHTLLRSPIATFMTDRMLEATFAPEPVPPGYREEAHALWLRPGQFKANREDVLSFVPAVEEMSGRYNEIGVPAVIAVGSEDPFGTLEQAYRLKEHLKHAELIVMPEVAHMIPQNHPERVMEAVNRLAKLRAS